MVLKWLGLVAVAALCFCGCLKRSGSNVEDLLSSQERHAQQISEMSKKVDSVDEKLSAIEKSINALLAAGSGTASTSGDSLAASSSFAETEEYKDIMRQIGVLQEQVGVVQGEFAGFQNEEQQAREVATLRDRGSAWRAMGDPEEMSRRMDILVKNFSGKIADRAARDRFISDVESLKAKYSASLSLEQKRAEARALISQAVESSDNDRFRERLESQLRSLDEEQNAEQLEERVDRVLQFQRMREIGEVVQKYNIPEETVRDSGLMSFGRGGPPGFFPMRERGREQ